MASNIPKQPPDIDQYAAALDHMRSYSLGEQKSKAMARALEISAAKGRAKTFEDLLKAFEDPISSNYGRPVPSVDMPALGDVIRRKIEEHRNIIASLEWFASHLSLDKPEEHLFVNRIILEGLHAMAERQRKEGL